MKQHEASKSAGCVVCPGDSFSYGLNGKELHREMPKGMPAQDGNRMREVGTVKSASVTCDVMQLFPHFPAEIAK